MRSCSKFSTLFSPPCAHIEKQSSISSTAMAENTEIVSKEEGPKKPINLFSLFPNLKLQFPFWKRPEPNAGASSAVEDETSSTQKPGIASFPRAQPVLPPVAAETDEPMTRTSNPILIWQVYAFGGFLIAKWIWARWQERKDQKEDEKEGSSDDEQSSVDE